MKDKLVKIGASETLVINEQSNMHIKNGKNVYKFGFGQSPFLPPKEVRDELVKSVKSKEYTPVQGIPELRRSIASFHSSLLKNTSYSEDQVIIAPGSKMLLYCSMMAFNKADVFLITPSWVSYEPQAHLLGHNVHRIQTQYNDKWRLTPELFEEAVSKTSGDNQRLLVINYPGNPDGLTYSEDELKALADVARKYNVYILSDEIYGLLNFENNYSSIADYYPEGTLVTTGLSKWCGAGGWRLGAMLIPEEFKQDFKNVFLGLASETYSCAPSPIQWAALKAYESMDVVKNYLSIQQSILNKLGQFSAERLRDAGVRCYDPVGGFYIMPDFENFRDQFLEEGINNSQDMCEKILAETGVAILPGVAFGFDESYLVARLAFVDFDGQYIIDQVEANGMDILNDDNFVEKYAPKVFAGINKLKEWASVKVLTK
tara:strand:+ start:17834 stop:19123 length:1290 start_codon:yes stop_codon:yes gene_type:complete